MYGETIGGTMTNVQERVPTAAIAMPAGAPQPQVSQTGIGAANTAMVRSNDVIRRMQPQYAGVPVDLPPGRGSGIIQQLLNIIQQLLGALGFGGFFGGGFSGYPAGYGYGSEGPETYFQNADGASVGDPHLSFNGTTGFGTNDQSHFDSMAGHNDLLDSASFSGGYQISTSVTQPGANGVTYNQQATIGTNFGSTQVSLDNSGNAVVQENGQTFALANGQSYNLGNGETVTRNADGSVVVSDSNGMGGNITTTLRDNGKGVDVTAQASNVDLGGDLVNQAVPPPSPAPSPAPPQSPIIRPIVEPVLQY
jgi:hypothetical protein